MAKRLLYAMIAILVPLSLAAAAAEGGLTGAVQASKAAETAAPKGAEFSGSGIRITLPEGMSPLEGDELAGYAAAADFDYPDTAQTLLVAVDAARGAALTVAAAESGTPRLEAAREAAEALIGDANAVREETYGKNICAAFSCAVNDQPCHLYYFSDGERLIIAGQSGLEADEIEAALASLEF